MQQSTDGSTSDFLADLEQQRQEFLRRIALVAVTNISGIVSASGAGGTKDVVNDRWSLVFHFDGWRQEDMSVQTTELRVEMPVPENDLSTLMARISPYDLLQVKGQIADHPSGRKQALVQEIVSFRIEDTELEARVQELQKPVTVENPWFGTLTLDRSLNWFCGSPTWANEVIGLNLSMDNCDSIEQPLAVAGELWDSETEWNNKIIECAVQYLLPLKNDTWLEEGEAELTADDFKKRISLEAITVYPDGTFEFWYDDGDLFWGHSIMVSGSLVDGLDGAGIHG